MPPSKKKTKKKTTKRPRASRASWSEGERRVDRMAAKAGVKPVRDVDDLPHLTPDEGEKFMAAIRQLRAADQRASEAKEKQKRAPRRA